MWRQRLNAIGFAFAGSVLGVLAVLVLTERPADSLIVVAALLGAVVVTAVVQSVRM
jgi:hypothetical protein